MSHKGQRVFVGLQRRVCQPATVQTKPYSLIFRGHGLRELREGGVQRPGLSLETAELSELCRASLYVLGDCLASLHEEKVISFTNQATKSSVKTGISCLKTKQFRGFTSMFCRIFRLYVL